MRERFADDESQQEAMYAAASFNYEFIRGCVPQSESYQAAGAANVACGPYAWAAAWNVTTEARVASPSIVNDFEARAQAGIIRHVIGNPFRPVARPEHLPSASIDLAQALQAGEDVSFALADALEEAGLSGIAQHFRDETDHPRGCWALDLILGKS